MTSVASACTRWNAGLSSRARLLEWTSFFGPRPHFSPLATSSSSTTPLAPSDTVTVPSGSCDAAGMKTLVQRLSAAAHLGPPHDLLEVRRADLLLPLRDEHEVDRALAAGAVDGVERGQERGLRPLLVHRAAADQDLAEAGLVDERRLPRRRRPLGGIDLLDVVHEVEADGPRRAGVQRREDAGLAVGGDAGDLLEAGLPREAHHERAPLLHPPVLGGDRRLLDPFLEARDALRMTLDDLGLDRVEAVVGAQDLGEGEGGRGRGRGTQETPVERVGSWRGV